MPEPMALLGLYPQELEALVKQEGQSAFRAKQLFSWLHKGARFDEMTNLPLAFRERLAQISVDQPAQIIERRLSKLDGTEKYLYSFRDGHCVEGVLMRYKHGNTLCISTQVGCKMGCLFCASTLQGCVRNLSAAEMMGEVLAATKELKGDRISNIVLMGSGEPLDNYDEVLRFLKLVSHEQGLNIGLRHISLSTCGLVPEMLRFANEGLPVTLSVSLHAPNDDIRKRIMPIAARYPIEELMAACRLWVSTTGRRMVFEYALIKGINSDPAYAKELSRLLRGFQCHVNLIPLNDVPERQLQGVSKQEANAFLEELDKNHVSATIRREMGDDIEGACGQLRRRHLEDQAAENNTERETEGENP